MRWDLRWGHPSTQKDLIGGIQGEERRDGGESCDGPRHVRRAVLELHHRLTRMQELRRKKEHRNLSTVQYIIQNDDRRRKPSTGFRKGETLALHACDNEIAPDRGCILPETP